VLEQSGFEMCVIPGVALVGSDDELRSVLGGECETKLGTEDLLHSGFKYVALRW
jgi:hypothetical protein